MSRSIFQEDEDMGVKAPDAEGCIAPRKQDSVDTARGSPAGVKNPKAPMSSEAQASNSGRTTGTPRINPANAAT